MDYAASILGRLPKGKRATGVNQLLTQLEGYMSPEAIDNIMEAYRFGASAHEGQKRVSGAPYISHPVAVATILAEQRMDAQTIIAAILHDVIEDTSTVKGQL
ncbi:MAG: HD domain-containing protein, partial [Proteobacteria bacterium]|nr:HD domain-containing protein [Pseudomonadota bacterium]